MIQNKNFRRVFLMALAAFAIQCESARAVVIYDNLGSAPYHAVGYASFGLYSDGVFYDRGMQFTAVQTVTLTNLEVAMGEAFFTSGNPAQSGTAQIQLLTDSADTTGTVLETWTSTTISGSPPTGGVHSFASVQHPMLTAGSKYWIVLSAADGSNLGGAWYFADDQHTGNTLTLWYNHNTGTPNYSTLTRGFRTRVTGGTIMPTLNIERSGNDVQISWTINAPGGTLQGVGSLNPFDTWTNISMGTIIGDQYIVTEPLGDSAKFYRLVH